MFAESLHIQLLWPLRVDGLDAVGGLEAAAKSITGGDSHWRLAEPCPGDDREQLLRYAETVYFHPFIRDLLFQKSEACRVLERDDVRSARVRLVDRPQPIRIDLRWIRLYLFDTNVALLALSGRVEQRLELREAENFLDSIRRAYRPYFIGDNHGHCRCEVAWENKDEKVLGTPSDYGDGGEKKAIGMMAQRRSDPPVAAHWEWLLQPLQPGKGKHQYRQIIDDRIPLMAHIAVQRPEMLTRGDFVRLALLEEQGDSADLPYSEAFLQDFETRYCYDRFWDPEGPGWMKARYLCAGYSYVAVGEWVPSPMEFHPGFFMDAEGGALAHFQRHYFHLGLLALLQEAALLTLLDDLSAVAKDIGHDRGHEVVADVRKIRRRLTRFVGLYWFTEVSNHEQAKELYLLWTGHLASERLYREVLEEIEFVDKVLQDEKAESEAKWRDGVTLAATVAAVAAVLGSILGMSVFVEDVERALESIVRSPDWLAEAGRWFFFPEFVAVVALAIVALGCIWMVYNKLKPPQRLG